MIWLILIAFVFICISSIFYPALRKIALCLITTVAVIVGGLAAMVHIFGH